MVNLEMKQEFPRLDVNEINEINLCGMNNKMKTVIKVLDGF